jgi:cytochrome b subunit of formate dehydrogenase
VIYFYIGKEISKSFSAGMRYVKNLPTDEATGTIFDKQKKLVLFFVSAMIIFILISGGIFFSLENKTGSPSKWFHSDIILSGMVRLSGMNRQRYAF